MDIQVGDRVTYKSIRTGEIRTLIIDGTALEKDMNAKDSKQFFEILKIERPKYEVIEEKKELLTEEEKEFLKCYMKLTTLKFNYIVKDSDYLYLNIDGTLSKIKIELNDFCFKNLKVDVEYKIEELGL